MDAYSSPIPFEDRCIVSEEMLKSLKKTGDEICGDIVSIDAIPYVDYKIEIVMEEEKTDENGKNRSVIWAYITLLSIDEDVEIGGSFVFYVKSADVTKYCSGKYTSEEDNLGCRICSAADLFVPEKKFIIDGQLTLEIKGLFFMKADSYVEKPLLELCERLFNDEDERDFTIVAGKNDKKVIKVHKLVLSMRSSVFKRMFKTDMKEKAEGKAEIIDFDHEIVRAAIEYCYDRDIFVGYIDGQTYIDLHQFADKYDIKDLKDEIELSSIEWITFENVCEVANALADLNSPKLQDICFRFLLMALRNGIPVKYMESLNGDIAKDLLQKSSSLEYC